MGTMLKEAKKKNKKYKYKTINEGLYHQMNKKIHHMIHMYSVISIYSVSFTNDWVLIHTDCLAIRQLTKVVCHIARISQLSVKQHDHNLRKKKQKL